MSKRHKPEQHPMACILPSDLIQLCEEYNSFGKCANCKVLFFKDLGCLQCASYKQRFKYTAHGSFARIDTNTDFYGEFDNCYDVEMWDYVRSQLCDQLISFGSASRPSYHTNGNWFIRIVYSFPGRMKTRLRKERQPCWTIDVF